MKKIFFLLTLLLAPLVYAQQLDTLEPAQEQKKDSLSLEYQAKKHSKTEPYQSCFQKHSLTIRTGFKQKNLGFSFF